MALDSITNVNHLHTVKKLANKPFLVGSTEGMQCLPESKKQLFAINHASIIRWVEPSYGWVINRAH